MRGEAVERSLNELINSSAERRIRFTPIIEIVEKLRSVNWTQERTPKRIASSLSVISFERPAVVSWRASAKLTDSRSTRQVKVVEGDLFKDPIPAGHDVVLIANVMHLLSAERNLVLLRLTRQCVPDGGACYLRITGRMRPTPNLRLRR
jgi:hypothetical protein